MMRLDWNRFTRQHYVAFGLVWMGFIFFMSARPSIPVPGLFDGQDKFMHAVTYAILGLLWARAWRPPGQRFQWRHVAAVTLLCAAYGASDEFHQMYVPGRDMSIVDWVADVIGGFLGAVWHRRRESRDVGTVNPS